MASPKTRHRDGAGNYVSEWFGHRLYPAVVANERSMSDQAERRCPFLTEATGAPRECVKRDASKGVCTINSASNGVRQDWLVCPYRALNRDLIAHAVRRLFALESTTAPWVVPAITLAEPSIRREVASRTSFDDPVFVYFDAKLGGELSIPQTDKSPELSFDVTIIELVRRDGLPRIGRVGILEIQTMDFHGSYRMAVQNLRESLRLHRGGFGEAIADNQRWLSEGVEGPNIANVFKRTFYQMMFKFQLGRHERCVGCVLALPKAVWDSWQKHLGGPRLAPTGEGTSVLAAPDSHANDGAPAWILVFDTDPSSQTTPSPLRVHQTITTSANAVSHWALDAAPRAALETITADNGLFAAIDRRVRAIWPALAEPSSS